MSIRQWEMPTNEKPTLVAMKFLCRCGNIFIRKYSPVNLDKKMFPRCPKCKGFYSRFHGLVDPMEGEKNGKETTGNNPEISND